MVLKVRKRICLLVETDGGDVIAHIGDVVKITTDLSREPVQGKLDLIRDFEIEIDCSREYQSDRRKVSMNHIRGIEIIRREKE